MAARLLVRLRVITYERRIDSNFVPCRLLVLMEWMVGYGLGRPSSIHDEE